MFSLFLKAVVGAILWTLANVVYYDLKRKGIRNFGRFAAFWVGTPTTWITFFVVRENRLPTFRTEDDDEALLHAVRTDRARRIVAEKAEGIGPGPAVDTTRPPPLD